MTDLRKFCWGTFVGMGGGAAAQDHGLWNVPPGIDATGALIATGLMLGCLAVIIFGSERAPEE